jgi:hypothetical protein
MLEKTGEYNDTLHHPFIHFKEVDDSVRRVKDKAILATGHENP